MTYFLDPAGDALAPAGCSEVRTEAEFLRLALTDAPLVIRGDRLCAWAECFAEGRGLAVNTLLSPASELARILPTWPREHLTGLLRAWPELPAAARQSLPALGAAIGGGYPLNTAEHAAQWLLTCLSAGTERGDLLTRLGQALADQVWEEWKAVFLESPERLPEVLFSWLGLQDTAATWVEPFPLPLSTEAEALVRDRVRHMVAAQGWAAFDRWQANGAPVMVLQQGALALADWLVTHPEQLELAGLRRLRDYLPVKTYQDLTARLPVTPPSPVPENPATWGDWMRREYLPYRTAQQADQQTLLPIQRNFAERFLRLYSTAVSVGTHADYLVWKRSAALRHSEMLTLVVIADGLSFYDLTLLQGHLTQLDTAQRLSDCGVQVAFPALPTITHQAKPSLVRGVAPVLCKGAESLGADYTAETKVEAALRAGSKGDVVFWNYVKTDKLYHDAATLSQARTEANATLMALAERILGLMLNAIPADVPAQLVITSDHGRLLMPSRRTVAPPDGFRPEGRAAFGEWDTIPAEGFELQDDYALLGRTRFGLNEDAAVMWGNQMFFTATGATGGEVFPHGGITPEEVLIPWAVYGRDLAFRLPTVEVGGSGVAEEAGVLTLRAINPNALPLTVTAASGTLADRLSVPLPLTLQAHGVTELVLPVACWPKQSELGSLQLSFSLQAGEGAAQNVTAQLNLQSEEMYSSTDDILDGLL